MYHATKPNLCIRDKFLIDKSGNDPVFIAFLLYGKVFPEDSLRVRGNGVFGMHRYSLCVSAIFRGTECTSKENFTSQCFHPTSIG